MFPNHKLSILLFAAVGLLTIAGASPSDDLTASVGSSKPVPQASDRIVLRIDQEADIVIDGDTSRAGFGKSVAVGDINGDGIADLAVGANNANIGGRSYAGATYIKFVPIGAEVDLPGGADIVITLTFAEQPIVLPGMLAQRAGKIINVSSILGRMATPFNGAYASSKFALEGLSESMRAELWPLGVHVAIVEPGAFDTDFQRNQVRASASEDPGLPYGPYIQRYNSRHQRFNRLSSDPVSVSKVIHKILRSRRPAFRHPVGIDARLGMLGARFLPERLFQTMVSRATLR